MVSVSVPSMFATEISPHNMGLALAEEASHPFSQFMLMAGSVFSDGVGVHLALSLQENYKKGN